MSKRHSSILSNLAVPLVISPFLLGAGYVFWSTVSARIDGSTSMQSIAQTETKFSSIESVPAGTFAYGGSTTWAPIRQAIDPLIEEAHPNFQLQYTEAEGETPGSGTGVKMLLNDQLSFSQSSRGVKEEEYQQARVQDTTLTEIPVAIDGVVVTVHPNLPVDSLTIDDLKSIYQGIFTNWQDLGGPDLEIVPYSRRRADSGTIEFFVDRVLDNNRFGSSVEFVDTVTVGVKKVSENLGGIYFGSAPEVVSQCKVKPLALVNDAGESIPAHQGDYIRPGECPEKRNKINFEAFQSGNYPLTRRLYVISKESERAGSRAAKAYTEMLLTGEGQRLLQELGFVPMRGN